MEFKTAATTPASILSRTSTDEQQTPMSANGGADDSFLQGGGGFTGFNTSGAGHTPFHPSMLLRASASATLNSPTPTPFTYRGGTSDSMAMSSPEEMSNRASDNASSSQLQFGTRQRRFPEGVSGSRASTSTVIGSGFASASLRPSSLTDDSLNAANMPPPPKASTLIGQRGRTSFFNTTTTRAAAGAGQEASSKPVADENQPPNIAPATATAAAQTKRGATSSSTASTSSQQDMREFDVRRWVIVFGFTSLTTAHAVAKRFESFGTIIRRVGTPGTTREVSETDASSSAALARNWAALQYSTELEAEKAICQNGMMLNFAGNSLIVGVLRCTLELSDRLGLQQLTMNSQGIGDRFLLGNLLEEDLASSMKERETDRTSTAVGIQEERGYILGEDDILLAGRTGPVAAGKQIMSADGKRRERGIIESILAWFFMW